jgi:hypothetical protein
VAEEAVAKEVEAKEVEAKEVEAKEVEAKDEGLQRGNNIAVIFFYYWRYIK